MFAKSRTLRAVVRNALVWGAGWAALSFVVFNALLAAGLLSGTMWWADGLLVAVRFGMVGVLAGGAFSAAVRLLYQGRRLSHLSPVRFGIAGGVVAGVFVPAFLQAMNVLSGGEMVPMALVLDDAALSALFGAVAAGGTLKLAQHAAPALPSGAEQAGIAGGAPGPAAQRADGLRHARRA